MNRILASLLFGLVAASAPAQDAKDTKVDFHKQIWPILEKRCIECHTTAHTGADGKLKKPKGGVTLDSKVGITTSKGSKVIIAKNSADSLLYASITLAADDEDRMPPAKKGDPLPKEQTDLIQKWIEQGAEFGTWTGKQKEIEKENGDKPTDKPGKPGDKPASKPASKPGEKAKPPAEAPHVRLEVGLKHLPSATLAAFVDGPFAVTSIGEGSPLLAVTCAGHTDDVDDKTLANLAPLAEHVTSLDLGHSKVSDDGCAVLARMPRLTTLDLRQTMVSNHGIAALAACKELRSLNLFGTKAGDYGIAALGALKHLDHLYVWQTEVSAAAVVRLRESLPEVRVVVAADLPDPMSETPAGGRRRAAK